MSYGVTPPPSETVFHFSLSFAHCIFEAMLSCSLILASLATPRYMLPQVELAMYTVWRVIFVGC